ncbi:MAG: GDP-mannose 4,6-dehydratase, partial [Brevinematia bacterium]
MKILVTGGAGFIGSEFVRQAVKQNHNVCVVDALTYAGDIERLKEVEPYITFYHADIRDYEELDSIFAKEKPEAVVHFAAESHVDRSILEPRVFLQTNIEGTFNLLELSKKYGVEKFINISTDEVYGELGEEGKFTEETPLKP